MRGEFLNFMKQYGVIGLAIAVIIGGKANALVTALVDGIIMPVVTVFVPGGEWKKATWDLGSVHLLPGPVLSAALDFFIVALFVYWFSKWILKEAVVAKK
ncbi:MAG: MscL family protein [Planctomycetota bacterium]